MKQQSQLQKCRQETIRKLTEYKRNEAAIVMYNIELNNLRESIEDDSCYFDDMAMAYDTVYTGKTNKVSSPVENKIIAMQEQEKILRRQIRELKAQNRKIDHILDCLPQLYSKLLRERHINGNEWKDVTAAIGYSYSQQYVQKELNEKALNMATGYLFPELYNVWLFLMLVPQNPKNP